MPFVTPEDVGTTPRGSLSAKRRLQAWERTGGICVVCERRIDGVRERWIVEHMRALELGGADELDNMGPAHEACGRSKTLDDHARTALAKRQKLRHLGAVVTSYPLQGSRISPFKRKINGEVVRRDHLPPVRTDDEVRMPLAKMTKRVSDRLPVDPTAKPRSHLCTKPGTFLKENQAGMTDPMARQPTTAPDKADVRHTNSSTSGEILPQIPKHLDFLFADRPLLPGEDPEQYDALLRSVVQQVMPTDVIEAIWVKDIIDLIWEAKRLRRWRDQILNQARLEAITTLIMPVIVSKNPNPFTKMSELEGEATALALGWLEGSQSQTTSLEQKLQGRGLTGADVMAQAFQRQLPDIERIDRMVTSADQRRDTLLREIERKRASLGQLLRAAAADVIDVEPSKQDAGMLSKPRR